MMTPNDRRKVQYCADNNGGKCPYKFRNCDGLCNNCPLDITPGDRITTGAKYQPRTVLTEAEANWLETRCNPPQID